jgi:tRNA U34 5-carboxymethylaminomethyl modifying GTPase MnmE/TrmE
MSDQNNNIDQVRELLFGEQIRSTEEALNGLRSELNQTIKSLEDTINHRFAELEKNISTMDHRLTTEDDKLRDAKLERKKLAQLLRNVSDKIDPEPK